MVSRSAGIENVEIADRAVGIGERRQQPQKPLPIDGEIGRRVQRRIDVEVDPKRLAVGAVVNRDRQVLDRTERKIVRGRAMAGKAEAVIERHDVDAQPEQRPAVDVAADIAAHVRQLIALMLQRLRESAATSARRTSATVMPGCSASRSGSTFDAMPGMRRDSRARAPPPAAPMTTSSAPVEAMQEDRRRRGHDAGERWFGCERPTLAALSSHERGRYAVCSQEARRPARRPAAERQAAGLRPRRQRLGPILPVLVELPDAR